MTTNWFRSLRSRFDIAMGRRRAGSRRGRVLSEASRSVVDTLESRTMLTVSAVDDTIAVRRLDVTLAIDVLANDSGTNGAPLIDSFTQPLHGSVQLLAGTGGARDRLAYTPNTGYAGTDAFAYTILDADGVPETADVGVTLTAPATAVIPAGPRGAAAYALSDGFVVGPFTAYTHQAWGNFSFTDSKATTEGPTWTDGDGIVHSVSGSGLETLVVTSTTAADGSWTYHEAVTSAGNLVIAPASGTRGLTETLSGSYQHAFAAAGGAAGSAYTFSASGGQSVGGSFVYAWNTAGVSSGSTTTSFTDSIAFSAAVSNTFTASTNVSTGTSLSSGSCSSSSTTTGSYSYAAGTGTVSGTITESEGFGNSHAYTQASGSYSEHGAYSSSCSGGGTYAYVVTGGRASGTVSEGDTEDNSYLLSTTSVFSGGAWTESGSASFTDDSTYTSTGAYADTGSGGWVIGTSTESGGEHLAASSHWNQTLGTNGKWQLNSGSGTGAYHASGHSAYSGHGAYSRTLTGGTASGSTVESGGDYSSTDSTWSEVVDSAGKWQLNSGTSEQQVGSSANWSYTGSGSYDPAVHDGILPGTMTEAAGGTQSASLTVSSHVAAGVWVSTGSAAVHADGYSGMSYSGGGTYARPGGRAGVAGLINGTMQHSGGSGSSYTYDATAAIGSDGKWHPTSGSAVNSQYGTDSFSFNGQSSYSSGTGTMGDSGFEQQSYNVSTSSWIGQDGKWLSSGSAASSASGSSHQWYSGTSPYTRVIDANLTVQGTITESGDQQSSYDFWTADAGDADGVWSSSGGGTSRDVSFGSFTYSGSGTGSVAVLTATPIPGGQSSMSITGTSSFSESGSQAGNSETAISWLRDGNNWIATSIESSEAGSGTGTYAYNAATTVVADSMSNQMIFDGSGAVVGSQGQSMHQSTQITDAISRSFGYDFGRSMSMSLDSNGSQVTSSSDGGSYQESGQASHSENTTLNSSSWNSDAEHIFTSFENNHHDQTSGDNYLFSNWWSELSVNGSSSGGGSGWSSASGGSSASPGASGWRSASNTVESGWSDCPWDASGSASGGGSSTGSSSGSGSESSGTNSEESYCDASYYPGFSAQRYYFGPDVGGTYGSGNGPTGAGQGSPATTTSVTPTMAGAASSSGSTSGSTTGGNSSSGGTPTTPSSPLYYKIISVISTKPGGKPAAQYRDSPDDPFVDIDPNNLPLQVGRSGEIRLGPNTSIVVVPVVGGHSDSNGDWVDQLGQPIIRRRLGSGRIGDADSDPNKPDLGRIYGRVKYEIEQGGLLHDSTIKGSGAGGTRG